MAKNTVYIVQAFAKQGKALRPEPQRKVGDADAAIAGAKRLQAKGKAGVVAYSVIYDDAADETEPPTILYKSGSLPPELAGGDD